MVPRWSLIECIISELKFLIRLSNRNTAGNKGDGGTIFFQQWRYYRRVNAIGKLFAGKLLKNI
jgi:hypothetical protein